MAEMTPSKQEEFCLRIIASDDLNLFRIAKEMGFSWSRDILPLLREGGPFADAVSDALQSVRFAYIGALSRSAKYGKSQGLDVNPMAIKEILRMIDSNTLLIPKGANGDAKGKRSVSEEDIEGHLARLNLAPKDEDDEA